MSLSKMFAKTRKMSRVVDDLSTADDSVITKASSVIQSSTHSVLEQLEVRQMFSVPNAPFQASAAAASGTTVNVAWHDNSWDETGFAIERRTTSGSYSTIGTVGTNVVGFTDYSAQPGSQYIYRISAFSAGGSSNTIESNVVSTPGTAAAPAGASTGSGNPYALPNGPFSLAVSTSGNTATLNWHSNSNNELGFTIQRSTDGSNYTSVGTTGAGVTNFVDSGLAAYTTYYYRVTAYNYGGTSSAAGPVGASTGAATTAQTTASAGGASNAGGVPNAPFGMTAVAGAAGVQLGFYDNSNNESGFIVLRSTSPSSGFTQIASLPANATFHGLVNYTDTSAAGGTTYYYQAYAVNGSYQSNVTSASATTSGSWQSTSSSSTGSTNPGGAPNGPFSLTAASTTSGVYISFYSNSTNETGFVILRSTSPNSGFSQIASLPPAAGGSHSAVTYTDTSATPGTTYYYSAYAVNGPYASGATGGSVYYNGSGTASAAPTPTPTPSIPPSTTTTSSNNGLNTPGFFPIGVYRQPVLTFPTWKARGINTVIDFYTNDSWMQAWIQAAQQNGLEEVRNPQSNIAADLNDPNLLAYEHSDEPDIQGEPTSQLAAEYAQWKAANPKIPVIVNVSAANAQYSNIPGVALTSSYYQGVFQTADIVSSDVYPVSAWNHPQWIDKAIADVPDQWNLTTTGFTPGNGVDAIRGLSGGKTQWAYIETAFLNNQEANAVGARGATADEVRGETWDAIIHGAQGIVYFPFTFPGTPDGTPPDVAAAMTVTDAKITSLAGVLSSGGGTSSTYINLPGGMEAMSKSYGGHTYYFVLDDSHTAAGNVTFTLPGMGTGTVQVQGENRTVWAQGGAITDNFSSYGIHVYVV